MADATLKDYSELVGKVAMQEFPIMPQPTWGQDAAYVAFVIDGLVAANQRLRGALIAAGVRPALVDEIANGEA